MPARPESLHVTDAYRAHLLALRQRAVQLVSDQWRVLDRDRLDATFSVWLAAATATLTEAQRVAARTSGSYLAAYVASETSRPRPAPTTPAESGVGRDGRPVREVLAPVLVTVKVRLAQSVPGPAALRSGEARAVRLVASEVVAASRTALDRAMLASDDVAGWRRVPSRNACGACLAAATGAIQRTDVVIRAHDHCRCTKEPVIRDAPDQVRRPTGEEMFGTMSPAEQDALFSGRGGAEKAALVRSGDVPFSALIAPVSLATMPDGITEAPLETLLASR